MLPPLEQTFSLHLRTSSSGHTPAASTDVTAVLNDVAAYKIRPAPDDPPGKWETGTQSFESLAGITAAVDYIASLGDGELAP